MTLSFRRLRRGLKETLGYDRRYWTRVVMDEACTRMIAELDPA